MEWTRHAERVIYDSPWVRLSVADVELPSGRRLDHHVVRVRPAAGTVVHDPNAGVLMLYRHRFITDSWGYEIPAGGIDPDESAAEAAARECLEETGWEPSGITPLASFYPSNGLSDQEFFIFTASAARHVGDPTDPDESSRIEWLSLPRLRTELRDGGIRDGLTFAACCAFLALTDPT